MARELRAARPHGHRAGPFEPRAPTCARAGGRSSASCCRTWSRSGRRCRSRAAAGWACPVGVRANLALALARGGFDVVHGFEPGLPSLSYLALRDTAALAVATFFSPDRLFYPPGKAQRDAAARRASTRCSQRPRGRRRGRGALPGRLQGPLAGRRHRALPARRGSDSASSSSGVPTERAVRARRDPRRSTSCPAGSCPAPHAGRSRARAVRAAPAARPRPRAHGARRRRADASRSSLDGGASSSPAPRR